MLLLYTGILSKWYYTVLCGNLQNKELYGCEKWSKYSCAYLNIEPNIQIAMIKV